ncbi:hypothetical protein PG994_013531 [Apiospora phragmitis]|uniref:DUF7907 domain-containing protein n=1 Tax=Apiospora phragmitis TaxID=2905665 RepID=A0ABR1T8W2_9PEZI
MLSAVLSLNALGLAAAAPLESRQVVPHYPPTQQSKGFHLIANLTDPSQDFTPPVNSWQLSGIHVGAGLNDAVLAASKGQLFYQNGTAEQTRYNQAHTLSDGGTPLFPWGIAVDDQADTEGVLHGISINAGSGQVGIQLAQFPEHYPILRTPAPGTYVACNQTEPYYHTNYITVRAMFDTFDSTTGRYVRHVPENCVAITLVPQCAELPALPSGSMSSHEFANTVNCYADVASIDWPEYGP